MAGGGAVVVRASPSGPGGLGALVSCQDRTATPEIDARLPPTVKSSYVAARPEVARLCAHFVADVGVGRAAGHACDGRRGRRRGRPRACGEVIADERVDVGAPVLHGRAAYRGSASASATRFAQSSGCRACDESRASGSVFWTGLPRGPSRGRVAADGATASCRMEGRYARSAYGGGASVWTTSGGRVAAPGRVLWVVPVVHAPPGYRRGGGVGRRVSGAGRRRWWGGGTR